MKLTVSSRVAWGSCRGCRWIDRNREDLAGWQHDFVSASERRFPVSHGRYFEVLEGASRTFQALTGDMGAYLLVRPSRACRSSVESQREILAYRGDLSNPQS